MLDAGFVEAIDDLLGFLRRRNTGSNAETFDRGTLLLHLLPKRELEGELTLVDVESVERDSDSRLVDQLLDLGNLRSDGLLVVVSSSCELDVVSRFEDSRNETSFDGGGSPEARTKRDR